VSLEMATRAIAVQKSRHCAATSKRTGTEYLSQNLDRPFPTKDGGTLRTIREACDDMTSMGKQRELVRTGSTPASSFSRKPT
jgi:hypothetical protein